MSVRLSVRSSLILILKLGLKALIKPTKKTIWFYLMTTWSWKWVTGDFLVRRGAATNTSLLFSHVDLGHGDTLGDGGDLNLEYRNLFTKKRNFSFYLLSSLKQIWKNVFFCNIFFLLFLHFQFWRLCILAFVIESIFHRPALLLGSWSLLFSKVHLV